jgi:hypothetical protein
VVPHVFRLVVLQMPWGSGAPSETSEQMPKDVTKPQDLHASAQALLQQMPWEQNPDRQSVGPLQSEPLGWRPHLVPVQVMPLAQSCPCDAGVQDFLQTLSSRQV